MQVNAVRDYNNSAVSFNAGLTLKHRNLRNEPLLTKEFVKDYTDMVGKLGKPTDSVNMDIKPNLCGDYVMDVVVVRNNEKHKKAQALLLCPDIKKDLPLFLNGEYKWLVSWFKDKNGTEKLK